MSISAELILFLSALVAAVSLPLVKCGCYAAIAFLVTALFNHNIMVPDEGEVSLRESITVHFSNAASGSVATLEDNRNRPHEIACKIPVEEFEGLGAITRDALGKLTLSRLAQDSAEDSLRAIGFDFIKTL